MKESKEGLEWDVDWKDFDITGASVSDITAELNKINNLDLKNELLSKFLNDNKLTELIKSISFEWGTIIEISELNDNWEIAG